MIVTGLTQSYIHPLLLRDCGLAVVRGSVPTGQAGGLLSGYQRFHFFVLRKIDGEVEGGTGGAVLREVMIGGEAVLHK